jgi:hypothetical protein
MVATPRTRKGHIDLFRHLTPGQASVTKLQDLLCRGRMRRSAAMYGAAGTLELFAERGPMNA